jgi:multiple sugar transport system substrate-binding protein
MKVSGLRLWRLRKRGGHMQIWPKQGRGRITAVIGTAIVAVLGLAACTSSSTSGSGSPGAQVPKTANQTIVFATAGLGAEGAATKVAITGFEKLHPNITVDILNLSSVSTVAQQQEEKYFLAGSTTPDVLYTDVIWPPAFARAGWIANLSSYHPDTSAFFPGQAATGEYNGGIYAIPWFINAEGLYYRTDLVKTPPTTISELVSDAKAALAKDHSLKEGLAFEGDEAESAVTAWQSFGAQIGISDLSNIDTAANKSALTFEYDAIHTYKISPSAVTAWNEGNVADAWLGCQTPFALNWPYLFQQSETKTYPCVDGHTGWVPFPSATPQSSLGGDDLAINAKSTHKAAAWEFIQYLTSVGAQDTRAIGSGDPPSVKAAYNSTLFSAAPYFRQEAAVYNVVTPRAVTPEYAQISLQLQPMISSVLSGEATPATALAGTAPTVAQLLATAK